MSSTKRYLKKYSLRAPIFDELPDAALGISLVVTMRNELNIHQMLSSLSLCERPPCAVEVIVLIYSSQSDSEDLIKLNQRTMASCQAWQRISDRSFRILAYHAEGIPAKSAARSYALKIGMDEALRRFSMLSKERGIIVPLEADSTVSLNLLTELFSHFDHRPDSAGCAIRYRYPSFGTEYPAVVYQDALFRELHSRYSNQALRYAGFPFAFHICDSAWAVAADAYANQGGIDRHRAAASLHFLNKIMLLENFSELNSALIYLSPKQSEKQGRAAMMRREHRFQGDATHSHFTYHLQSFVELRNFFKNIPELYFSGPALHTLGDTTSYTLMEFLSAYFFDERIAEIRQNSGSITSFERRFFRWFNTLMVYKYLDFARDNALPAARTDRSALELLNLVDFPSAKKISSLGDLLKAYRDLDAKSHRAGWLVMEGNDTA